MTLAGWKTPFVWCALVALVWLGATSADAQTVITGPGPASASDSALRFNGTVLAVGPETVALRVDGQVARVPVTIARFASNGLDIDPSKLYAGLPVTVSLGSLRGTIVSRNDTTMIVRGPNGIVEVPPHLLRAANMAYLNVAFHDVNGRVTLLPVDIALDLQRRQLGRLAYGEPPNSATAVVIVSPRMPGMAVVATPTGTADIDLAQAPSALYTSPSSAFVGPATGYLRSTTAYVRPATAFVGSTAVAAAPQLPLMFEGSVATVTPTSLVLDTRGVLVTFPNTVKATVCRNGKMVTWRQLELGNRVQATVSPLAIHDVAATAVTYRLDNGILWTVPAAALPIAYRERTTVWMRDARGNVAQVPLETALSMQRTGAVYFAPGPVAVPPEEPANTRFGEPPFPESAPLPEEPSRRPYQPYDGGWPFDGKSSFDEPLENHAPGQ